jgi:hypothetical protein
MNCSRTTQYHGKANSTHRTLRNFENNVKPLENGSDHDSQLRQSQVLPDTSPAKM